MFIRLLSIYTRGSFGESLASNSKVHLKCISLINVACQVIPTIVSINSNKILFYPFTVKFYKCGGNYNTIDYPYPRVFIPNKVKNIKEKIF